MNFLNKSFLSLLCLGVVCVQCSFLEYDYEEEFEECQKISIAIALASLPGRIEKFKQASDPEQCNSDMTRSFLPTILGSMCQGM